MTIEIIHDSFTNGQNTQAVSQIRIYGVSKFWIDYLDWLTANMGSDAGTLYHYRNALTMFNKIPRFAR